MADLRIGNPLQGFTVTQAAQEAGQLLEAGPSLRDIAGLGCWPRAQQGHETIELGGGHRVLSLRPAFRNDRDNEPPVQEQKDADSGR